MEDTVEYDFDTEKSKSYEQLTEGKMIKRINSFGSSIWKAPSFMEGSTKTTVIFMDCYLNNMGFQKNITMLKDYSQYSCNSLVSANFADYKNGITETSQYYKNFYKSLLSSGEFSLRNRVLILNKHFTPGKDRGLEL